MTCTIYFSAEDQDGNALPFNADFILERWDGSRWVVEGTYTIPSGGMYRKIGLLDYPQSYNTVPLLDVRHEDDWKRPRDKTFTCRSGDVTFVYEKITPVPTEGILRVRAHDANTGVYLSNVSVYVDGIYKGMTLGAALLIFTVSPGFHTITLSKSGYHTKTISTYVSAGVTVTEDGAMDPVIVPGTLDIRSDPSDALAYVDGAYAGMTPLSITRDPGTYNVQVSKAGYKDSDVVPAYVESGRTRTVTFVLNPVDGELTVLSTPVDGAGIFINGSFVGLTSSTFDLAPGSYSVGVEKSGYITPSLITAMVLSGETTLLRFTLVPEPPKPIICIPAITGFNIPDEIRITFPPPPPAVPTPGPPPLPSLDTTSVPVTFRADMDCTQDGTSVSDRFPFSAEILLMGSTVGPPITVNAGNNTFDIASAITSLLLAGTITPDLTGIAVSLRYPTEIVDGTVTADTTTDLWLHISKIVLEHPVICLPSISDFTYPDEIKLTPVPGGLPTLDTAFDPVTFAASMNCTQGGSPVADRFPFYAEFYVAGGMIAQIPVSATNTIPAATLASAINAAIAAGAITPDMTGFSIVIRYPARIEDGVVTEYASVDRTISIVEIRDIFCDLAVTASDPGVIPFDILTVGALPTLAVPIPITSTFSAVCDNGAPVDLLTYIDATVYVNDVLFGTIIPDSTGKVDFNLATNTAWLSSIVPGATTMELKIRFPRQLKCTTPTPYGGTQDYTKPIRIEVKLPEIPECVLTDLDFFTCPDGTVIQINECVNGVKVPIVPTPTCPVAPPVCVLTDLDFYTCPDGTVIQINECVNGVKVPTGQTCPVVPPVCVLTDLDFFTCPDGTVIQLLECVNGVKVPIIPTPTCPVAPPECVLDASDFFTCPDGTVIQINECVNGVKVPTGQTCPVAPPVCVLTYADFFTCPDGTVIQINECVNGVKVPVVPTPTCPVAPPVCVLTDADFYTCPDGTVIQINECVNGVKVPIVPTPTCPVAPPVPAPPVPTVGRAMVMAIPNTVPEGRTVEIVVQALCAGVESDGEDATLLVDDVAVMTRPTKAGEVSFRWIATGIGTRMVCVSIPANPACPYPGAVCRSIMVVTYLPEVREQVELEQSEYETELAKLRKIRELERERLRGVAVSPGTVRIPPSLAGSTVVIGGIPRVVPPEGISVTVPAGEEIITVIKDGVREIVPVLIMPGETEKLPWGS